MQIYADLRILSARPTDTEMALVRHHLIGVADAADPWSTGRWLRAALTALADIADRGRPAVVVGGTGLYLRALTEGIADIPSLSPDVRRSAAAAWEAGGEALVRERLRVGDPESEAGIFPGDRQRLLRALEVLEGTGQALSVWRSATTPPLSLGSWRGVVLEPDRQAVYERCDARLLSMIEASVLDEVGALLARDLSPDLPVMKAVGVREFGAYLAGDTGLPAALALAQQETRRYVKRQMTWLRNQTPDWLRITAVDADDQWRQFVGL